MVEEGDVVVEVEAGFKDLRLLAPPTPWLGLFKSVQRSSGVIFVSKNALLTTFSMDPVPSLLVLVLNVSESEL